MLERSLPVLRVICVALAALLLFQVGRLVVGRNPLGHLNIPAVPTLPPDTNAPAGGTGPNSLAALGSGKTATNTAQPGVQIAGVATNAPSGRDSGKTGSNAPPSLLVYKGTNAPSPIAATKSSTNSTEPRSGTNETKSVARPDSARTNLPTTQHATRTTQHSGLPPEMAAMGMGPSGRPGATTAPELALPIRARVYGITDSEILGPIMRPMPMALLGIAGNVAFLRAANGQTGLVKEGDSLGGLKLLRIGTNRVLVEDDGQKKELTLFSGYGGESLLPKQKENSQ